MRQFTPGPYHVEAGRAIVDSNGRLVGGANAWTHYGDRVSGENKAPEEIHPTEADDNAYLLAESWTMYEALRLLIRYPQYTPEHMRGVAMASNALVRLNQRLKG